MQRKGIRCTQILAWARGGRRLSVRPEWQPWWVIVMVEMVRLILVMTFILGTLALAVGLLGVEGW